MVFRIMVNAVLLLKEIRSFQTAPWTGEDTFGKIQFLKAMTMPNMGR
ncbi:MAG: hypothetical protein ACLUI5_05285 [Fusicatenibacter saccharivorans]